MRKLAERVIVDKDGRKVGVFLTVREWKKILAELEELEAIRAYDEAKASGDEVIPFEQAVRELESRKR